MATLEASSQSAVGSEGDTHFVCGGFARRNEIWSWGANCGFIGVFEDFDDGDAQREAALDRWICEA